MTDQIKRTPAGIPTGGQFASHDRADATATLSAADALADRRNEALDAMRKLNGLRYRTAAGGISVELKVVWPTASIATFLWNEGLGEATLVRVDDFEGKSLYDVRKDNDNSVLYAARADGVAAERHVFAAQRIAAEIPVRGAANSEFPVSLGFDIPRVFEAKFGGEDEFIVVEGGLVQNSPLLPVWDMDELEHGDQDAIESIQRNLAEAEELGAHEIAGRFHDWLAGPN